MVEETTPWDIDTRLKKPDLREVIERELPELAGRIVFSAPLPGATGIYPLDNKHLQLVEGERIERHVEGERFLVRINDMREDPGFYGLFPSNDHNLSQEYEELMEEDVVDEGRKKLLEKKALEIAKRRVGKFDELLHKWQEESGDAFILPFYHRYFVNEEGENPLLLTVVQDLSDGYEALTEENNPHKFSAAARHVPGLRHELEDTATAYAKVVGDLPHNAAFVPSDIIGRWDQFGLVKAGGQLSVALIDNEPFLDVKSEEMKTQSRQIGEMYKMLDQLPQSTPLKSAA
jgi:hypothetical protein